MLVGNLIRSLTEVDAPGSIIVNNSEEISRMEEELITDDMESAHTPKRENSEHPKTYNRRLYTDILTSIRAAAGYPEMRVKKLWPNIDWERTWQNLKEAPVPENMSCMWYRVIHDLIPTNVRLDRINMVPTDTCWQCTSIDTLESRLIACGEERYGITRKP